MNNPRIPRSDAIRSWKLLQKHRWGWSQYVHVDEQTALARAWGKAGGASSLHFHRGKHNAFLVLTGKVEIVGPDGSPPLVLGPCGLHTVRHGCATVEAGVVHRMVFLEDSMLHELYQAVPYGVIDLDDITRLDDGWEPGRKPSG